MTRSKAAEGRPVLVLVTVPERVVAERIAAALVEGNIAAGVQLSGIESVYRWREKVEQASEVVLTVKTVAQRFVDIERVVDEFHPYEVPPVIQIGIERAKASYADWIVANSRST